jgi:hypothetical protein
MFTGAPDYTPDWSDPVPEGGDPYAALPPYWWALLGIICPLRDDALVAAEWPQVVFTLDQEPVPPTGGTFFWNMRWRKVVCQCWQIVREYGERQQQRAKLRRVVG